MFELAPYLKLYKKHWFSLSLGMILAFITAITSIGLLTLSGWFLSAAAVAGLTIARETFNYMLPGGGVRGLAIARTAGRWGERVVSHEATFRLLADLRIYFFRRLIPLIPGKYSKLRDADLLNRLISDVDAMDHVYLRLISPIIVGVLGITSLTIFLAIFDLAIALTLGGILLCLLIIWPILFYRLGRQNGYELTQNKAKLRMVTMDWLQAHTELVLFNAEPDYQKKIEQEQEALLANQQKNASLTGLAAALLMLANGWTLVLIIWMASDGIQGQTPDPLVAMMAFATLACFELLAPIAGAFQYLGQTIASAKRLNDIITAEPDVVYPSETDGITRAENFNIECKEVSFHYPDSDELVVTNLNFSLPAGHKMAIVGQTGSGKSSLLQLLLRQYDPNQGQIHLGGHPLAHWSEKSLRQVISVVSQRVDILNGTLKDNLLLAKPDASDGQLIQTLKQVGLTALVSKNEESLHAWLGEGGRQLSGGERRRLGIARALLHDAPILLLDEPTEGLDKQTEQQIMQLLKAHMAQKTVVFVTHRLVGLEEMDSIALMEQGQIIELGSHQELMAKKMRYYQLRQRI